MPKKGLLLLVYKSYFIRIGLNSIKCSSFFSKNSTVHERHKNKEI